MEKRDNVKKKKKIVIIISLILLLISILFIGGVIISKQKKTSSDLTLDYKYIQVPNMEGEVSSVAQEVLEKLGLEVEIKEKVDDSKEEMIGKVYKQNITGKIKKKEKIVLNVYVSSNEIKMPSVIGMNKDEAKDLLEKLGFNVSLEQKVGTDYQNDIVLSQEAANKEKIVKGSTIKLVYGIKKEEETGEGNQENNQSSSTGTTKPTPNPEPKPVPSPDSVPTPKPEPSPEPVPTPKPDPIPTEPEPEVTYKITIQGKSVYKYNDGPSKLTVTVTPPLPAGKKIVWYTFSTQVMVDNNGYVKLSESCRMRRYAMGWINARIDGTDFIGSFPIVVLGIKGDVTGDGMITGADASTLLDYIYYPNRVMSDAMKTYGDVNNDGVVDQKDVDAITKYYSSGHW